MDGRDGGAEGGPEGGPVTERGGANVERPSPDSDGPPVPAAAGDSLLAGVDVSDGGPELEGPAMGGGLLIPDSWPVGGTDLGGGGVALATVSVEAPAFLLIHFLSCGS